MKRFIAYTALCLLIMLSSFLAIEADQPKWTDRVVSAMVSDAGRGEENIASRFIEWAGTLTDHSGLEYASIGKPEPPANTTHRKNHAPH